MADTAGRMASAQAWLDALADRADTGNQGAEWVAQVCMLKNHATQTMQFCADQALQVLGGMGFMRGTKASALSARLRSG